jgi:hypothetical protein
MQTFTAASTTTPDPSKHVNYTQGMVLGADDFNQEFAFHNGRNEWLLRDLIGYGTTCGLRVSCDQTNGKTQVRVTAGAAVSPRGQMIRVCCDQCADLGAWLTTNQDQVTAQLGSPLTSTLRLYVTLCYRECPTDQVPLPGEPCRSEAEAMAPSRLKSDYTLDFRFSPPVQTEEDVLRRLVWWLRQIPLVDDATSGSPPDSNILANILEAIREAAKDAFAAVPESPPSSPPDIFVGSPPMFAGSPPSPLVIPAALACEIWRAVFRLWVTELRPMWQARFLTPNTCCAPDTTKPLATTEECLLLAELDVPVQLGSNQQWQIANAPIVLEEQRPFLLHLRLLQEWLLCGSSTAGLFKSEGVTHPSGLGPYRTVAAGIIKGDGTVRQPTYNNLQATLVATPPLPAGGMLITFDNYQPPVAGVPQYIVKVTPVTPSPVGGAIPIFDRFGSGGIQFVVTNGSGTALNAPALKALEFMIEVNQY